MQNFEIRTFALVLSIHALCKHWGCNSLHVYVQIAGSRLVPLQRVYSLHQENAECESNSWIYPSTMMKPFWKYTTYLRHFCPRHEDNHLTYSQQRNSWRNMSFFSKIHNSFWSIQEWQATSQTCKKVIPLLLLRAVTILSAGLETILPITPDI